jgi:ABC-type nitrate/sulfonate/bicarbonate transport system substrate-binding protein
MLASVRTWLPCVLLATALACTAPAAPPPAPPPAKPVAPAASTAPAGAPAASSAPAEPTVLPRRAVKVAYPALSLAVMSYFYAEDHGLYARYGVEAESIGMVTQAATAALVNGEIQYMYYGANLLLSAARGLPVRPFLQSSTGPSLFLFARPEINDFGDLRGKAISVFSTAGLSHEVTALVLEKHGVERRDVQLLGSPSAAAQMEHMRQGVTAAATISPPWPITARRDGYRLLSNIGQEVAYPFGIMGTTATRVAQDPAEVKAVIRATLEGNRLIRSDRQGTIEWIARRFEVEPDVAAESYDLVIETHNDNGEIPRDGVVNYFRIQEDQPDLRDVRYDDVVETRLLQEVWREMGLR